MNNKVTCNALEVFQKFSALSTYEMTKCMKSAVRMGSQALKKETISNARAGIKTYNNNPGQYNDSILDAVRVGKMHDEVGSDIYQIVSVLGTRNKGSQSYKFRFLEAGTRDRYQKKRTVRRNGQKVQITLKKPKYIGRITPRYFFRNAKNTVLPQLSRIFLSKINECMNKISK